jgi:hypothetical protein
VLAVDLLDLGDGVPAFQEDERHSTSLRCFDPDLQGKRAVSLAVDRCFGDGSQVAPRTVGWFAPSIESSGDAQNLYRYAVR